jgi:hypothetical protein
MTGIDTAGGVPAAWYPDPQGPPLLRWWDGSAWTAHTMERPAQPTPQPSLAVRQPVLQPAADWSAAAMEPTNAYVPMRDFADRREQPPRVAASAGGRGSTHTAAAWMLALYPLLQVAILLVITFVVESFGGTTSRYAITGSSVVFSLYCGYADSKTLRSRGYRAPGWGWALLPLVYFIIRTVRVGRSSLGPLFAGVALQLVFAAIVVASVLLPLYLASTSDGALAPGDRAMLLTPEGMADSVAADLAANGYEVTGVTCEQLASPAAGTRANCTAQTADSTLSVVVEATPADAQHAYAIVSGVEYAR